MKTKTNTQGRFGRKVGVRRPYKDKDGYIYVQAPDKHPGANHKGLIFEHRLVMENYIQRFLRPHELVHHKNADKSDNRIENLELTDRSSHAIEHNQGNLRKCETCGVQCSGGLRKRFCSKRCKLRSHYLRHKEQMIAAQTERWRLKRLAKKRKCPACGVALKDGHGNRKYCSDACSPWD